MRRNSTHLATILIVLLAGALAFAATGQAKTKPQPKPRCRAGYVAKRETVRRVEHVRVAERHHGKIVRVRGHVVYVRVREHHRLVFKLVRKVEHVKVWRCEKQPTSTQPVTTAPAPAPAPAATVSYTTSVDPSFTQSPSNALAVTYAYSASATSDTDGVIQNLATSGQLPAGVLNMYTATAPDQPAGLVCSMNVGGATSSGTCLVNYIDAGSYQVTTEYIPVGASPVTSTDTDTISPYSTTTSLTASNDGCNSGYNSNGEYLDSCIYTLTATTIDQNGNQITGPTGPSTLLNVANSQGANGTLSIPQDGTCNVDVSFEHDASDPNATTGILAIQGTNDADGCTGTDEPVEIHGSSSAWSLTASYQGSAGLTASTSAVREVSP
jgi:hypothetical protein